MVQLSNHRSCQRLAFAAAVLACGAGLATAQEARPSLPASEVLVQVDQVRNLRVTSLGQVLEDGWGNNPVNAGGSGFSSRACSVVSTHTNASFTGGQYIAQAGFAQGEKLGATYTIPAGDFPIKLDMAEVIFVTSAATFSTTTIWALSVYEGEPSTGNLIFREVSDGTILPHIQMPPGTNGTNVQFSVDPTDPDQIVIYNSTGTNKFTIAWEVVNHNNPSPLPCFIGSPTASNAFPATDVGGLQAGTANWLLGLNCGTGGCPPNGGWAKFSNLAVACRPTGDWVTRTTWSSLSCTPGVGACCFADGSCDVMAVGDCSAAGGTYAGDGTDCTTANCPQPLGACCTTTGFCLQLTATNCAGIGGTFAGANTNCGPNNTCPRGACCLPTGACVGSLTQAECFAQNGTFRGVGTQCSGQSCPQPEGACCFSTGFCISLLQTTCTGAGGTWAGPFTTCVDADSNGQADVCQPAGGVCDSLDYNGDGNIDPTDVDAYFSILGEGPCIPANSTCNDLDFNNDGNIDPADVDAYFSILGEGPCL